MSVGLERGRNYHPKHTSLPPQHVALDVLTLGRNAQMDRVRRWIGARSCGWSPPSVATWTQFQGKRMKAVVRNPSTPTVSQGDLVCCADMRSQVNQEGARRGPKAWGSLAAWRRRIRPLCALGPDLPRSLVGCFV